MEWPLKDPHRPSKYLTTPTNQEIWLRAAEVAANDQNVGEKIQQWQAQVRQCSSSAWRFAYRDFIGGLVQLMSEIQSPQVMIDMCESGLKAAHELMVVRLADQTTLPACEAFQNDGKVYQSLKTITFHGSVVDLPSDNDIWSVDDIDQSQLDFWANFGCMEASAAKHASNIICESNDKLNQLSHFTKNKLFVLLGATSEMGPSSWLMKIPGTQMIVVARPGAKLQNFISSFQASAHTTTTMKVPTASTTNVSSDGDHDANLQVGVDLLEQGPEIARWIVQVAKEYSASNNNGSQVDLVLCSLAYLDGEAHVRVTVAMDLIVDYVIRHWTAVSGQVILWYLTSPTTVMAIPPKAVQRAKQRYDERPSWQRLVHSLSLGSWLQPTLIWEQHQQEEQHKVNVSQSEQPDDSSSRLFILNNLVTLQGPNYALAKTMQQWRCIVEDWKSRTGNTLNNGIGSGVVHVVAPCAPPTRTQNMVSHPQIAASLDGLDYLPPLMAFSVQDASLLAAAILISLTKKKYEDESTKTSSLLTTTTTSNSGCTSNERVNTCHPMTIFWEGSVHGGYWESPYQCNSSGTVTYVLGSTLGQWKGNSS